MKKNIFSLILVFIFILFLTGCESYKSFTYQVGDSGVIEVKLDTSKGHDLTSSLPFSILKDKKRLCVGSFIEGKYYNDYYNLIKTNSSYTVIEEGEKENIKYIFYSLENSYSYVIKIKNSNIGIILDNTNSKDEAEKCFELLTFTSKK